MPEIPKYLVREITSDEDTSIHGEFQQRIQKEPEPYRKTPWFYNGDWGLLTKALPRLMKNPFFVITQRNVRGRIEVSAIEVMSNEIKFN